MVFSVVAIIVLLVILIIIFIIMENTKASAKDFFLHLGAIVALYTITVSFLNLVFKIINKAFPEVGQNVYAWGAGSEISMPVATLIVVFPIFIIISWLVYKSYRENPAKKELSIRRWLTYITLFIAGIFLVGDLVTVLYKFLDGQDLTAAFLLKVLAVFLVTGEIFWFYIQDIRDRISAKQRKIASFGIGAIILVFIILGFSVLGSPKTQRLIRYDNQKISDLQNIQWQVISYWQINGMIPDNLDQIKAKQPYVDMPTDPQFNNNYGYKKVDTMTFDLCAEFNREATLQAKITSQTGFSKGDVIQNSNWNHKTGYQCFTRIIDPITYPTQVRG